MQNLGNDSYASKLASLLAYTLKDDLPLNYIKTMWNHFLIHENHEIISQNCLLNHDRPYVLQELNDSENCDDILSTIKKSLKPAEVVGFVIEKYNEDEFQDYQQNIHNFCGHYKIKDNNNCFYVCSDNEKRVSIYEDATTSPKLGLYISESSDVNIGDIFGFNQVLIIIKDINEQGIIILIEGILVDNGVTKHLKKEKLFMNKFSIGRENQEVIELEDIRFSRVICQFENEGNLWKIKQKPDSSPKILKYFHNYKTLEFTHSSKVDITEKNFVFNETTWRCNLICRAKSKHD